MTLGLATFLAFRRSNFTTIEARYQSYWPGKTVDGFSFYPFAANAISSNSTGGDGSLTITFAPSKAISDLIEAGLAGSYFVEVSFFQFQPTLTDEPPTAKTLFATYLGELITATHDDASITLQVGPSLNPVEAQAPPRKMTTTLIGEPPKI